MGNSSTRGRGRETVADVVIVGERHSGKTSITQQLKYGEIRDLEAGGMNKVTEDRVYHEHMHINMLEFNAGGRQSTRTLIRLGMIQDQQAVILVIDSSNSHENTAFIPTLMVQFLDKRISRPTGSSIPLLVLANKQDIDGAMGADAVAARLDLHNTAKNFNFKVFPVTATTGEGLYPAASWLVEQLALNSKNKLSQDRRKRSLLQKSKDVFKTVFVA